MAESNTSAAINHLAEDNGIVAMSLARREAARRASHEIEMLAVTLRNINTGDGFDLVVRGMSKRIEAMAQVVMSSISDDGIEVSSLYDEIGCSVPQRCL